MITLRPLNQNHTEIIESFNEALSFLNKQRAATIPICDDDPATTVQHCLFLFDWVCQSYLNRYLNLAKAFSKSVNDEDALPAAMIGRGLVETVAQFHYLLNKIEAHLKAKSWDQVYHYIASYALGGNHGFKPEKKLKTLHVNNALEEIDKVFEKVGESYKWLCEFVHPNSLGTTVGFSQVDRPNSSVVFHEKIPFERGASPTMEAALWASIFQHDWERISKVRSQIASDWQPTEKVFELFESRE